MVTKRGWRSQREGAVNSGKCQESDRKIRAEKGPLMCNREIMCGIGQTRSRVHKGRRQGTVAEEISKKMQHVKLCFQKVG